MLKIDNEKLILVGSKGTIDLNVDDEIILKFSMLFEGECEGFGASLGSKEVWIYSTTLLSIASKVTK
jgi:hypothetical protein